MVILALPEATLAFRLLQGSRPPGREVGVVLPGAPNRAILALSGSRGAQWALVNITGDPPDE